MNIKSYIINHKSLILPISLWLMIWAGYNTGIERVLSPEFPRGVFDLIHGIRAFFPITAGLVSIFIIFKKTPFLLKRMPLSFFFMYGVIGAVSSLIYSKDPFMASYWGFLYISVILVLVFSGSILTSEKNIRSIIYANILIISFITVFLIIFLFSYQGVFSLNTVKEFIEGYRPFEGIGGIKVNEKIFDMPGTRPTGLGRYAAFLSLVMVSFALFYNKKARHIFFFLFFLFLAILIFSRARTSVIAFLPAIFTIGLLKSRSKFSYLFVVGSILLILIPLGFYHYFWAYLNPKYMETSSILLSRENTGFPSAAITNFSGRTITWEEGWKVILKSPFIGSGFHADRIFLDGQHMHNTWLQVLIFSGFAGLLLFVLGCVIFLLRFMYRMGEYLYDPILISGFSVFIFIITRSITESFAFFGADWLLLAPFIAYVQYLNPEKAELKKDPLSYYILHKKFNALEAGKILDVVSYWIETRSKMGNWIVLYGMHGAVESYKNKKFSQVINEADISLIDGMSIVLLGRLMGLGVKERIAGPDFMKLCLQLAAKKGYSVFFLGDTEDTLEKLKIKLAKDYPGLKIAGAYSPPFREFSTEDNKKITEVIKEKKPDILFVSFSLVKQELWIFENKNNLNVPVIIGVGAAFKFLSGKVRRAPTWMSKIGFEWLWRLFCEPKIIWKRVFLGMPIFLWVIVKDLFKK